MSINISTTKGFCVINLSENALKKNKSEELKTLINKIIEKGELNIFLDMEKINKIDSIGLGILLQIEKIAMYNDAQIKLYNLQQQVTQMLYQTKLNKIFNICETTNALIA